MPTGAHQLTDPDTILGEAKEFLTRAALDLRAYTHAELWALMLKLIEYVMAYVSKLIEAIENFAQVYASSIADIEAHELSRELLGFDNTSN